MSDSRVLIVDDDTALLQALPGALRLRLENVQVDTCDSALGALELIALTDYDTIVSDIKMPGMDGLALLAEVRALRPSTPTLLITGHGEHDLAVQALRGGAYDFVQKPIDRDYFVASLKRAIQVRQLSRKLEEQNAALERHASGLEQLVEERTRELTEASRANEVARAEAEAGERRVAFLAEASKVLASSLDYETTMASVARLAVPTLADWCVVDMLDGEGELRRLAVAHVDPAKVELARQIQSRYPADPTADHGVLKVMRTGQPEYLSEIPDALLAATARDAAHLEILREIGFSSYMAVPLVARDQVLGVLTFVSAESGVRYGPADLALAEDLARRASVAVDHAGLFRQAQEAIAARDEFLSIASHELKTPLTAIQAHIQMLLRSAQRDELISSEELAGRLQRVELQGQRLVKLINGLLDVARISAGKLELELEGFDLGAAVGEVAARFSEEAARAGCELQLEAHEPVVGRWDRLRIEQVITNLLSNGLKYGPGKPLQISAARDNGGARLVVQDHGIGIYPDQRERIFDRFERAVSSRNYGGLGLGLYIVGQIVNAHGGSIDLVSEPGVGSTFTIGLPLSVPATDHAEPRLVESSTSARS